MIFSKEERIIFQKAEVAELADALGSGSSGRKAVRVQVPPSAPTKNNVKRSRVIGVKDSSEKNTRIHT